MERKYVNSDKAQTKELELTAGADPVSKVKGGISVLSGSQVS